MDAKERLLFVLALASRNLRQSTKGEMLDLRSELNRFFGFVPVGKATSGSWSSDFGNIVPLCTTPPRRLTADQIGELRSSARALLRAFVSKSALSVEIRGQSKAYFGEKARMLQIVGTPVELWSDILTYLLLNSEHAKDVRSCPNEDCTNFFLRVRRQKYCSRTCTERAIKRKNRADEKDQPKPANGSRKK